MYVSGSIFIVPVGFLIGSIPFGVLLAKAFRLPDPRGIGSGNIGATNMLRTGRKEVALLTLLLDAGKGLLAVMLCHDSAAPTAGAIALFAAVMGHCYSPWLRGKGGKGVATMMGGAFGLYSIFGLYLCAVWLLGWLLTRFVSVGSIAAAFFLPMLGAWWFGVQPLSFLVLIAIVVIYRHHANLVRLQAGLEPQMGGKRA